VDITGMKEPEEFATTKVPDFKEFTPCQLIYVIVMAVVLAFLLGFIIYMSFTWNKVRPNEYA
jgi:succinate dehydrogenase hydrophobic anchor subunit